MSKHPFLLFLTIALGYYSMNAQIAPRSLDQWLKRIEETPRTQFDDIKAMVELAQKSPQYALEVSGYLASMSKLDEVVATTLINSKSNANALYNIWVFLLPKMTNLIRQHDADLFVESFIHKDIWTLKGALSYLHVSGASSNVRLKVLRELGHNYSEYTLGVQQDLIRQLSFVATEHPFEVAKIGFNITNNELEKNKVKTGTFKGTISMKEPGDVIEKMYTSLMPRLIEAQPEAFLKLFGDLSHMLSYPGYYWTKSFLVSLTPLIKTNLKLYLETFKKLSFSAYGPFVKIFVEVLKKELKTANTNEYYKLVLDITKKFRMAQQHTDYISFGLFEELLIDLGEKSDIELRRMLMKLISQKKIPIDYDLRFEQLLTAVKGSNRDTIIAIMSAAGLDGWPENILSIIKRAIVNNKDLEALSYLLTANKTDQFLVRKLAIECSLAFLN